jgi:hypothetical protein
MPLKIGKKPQLAKIVLLFLGKIVAAACKFGMVFSVKRHPSRPIPLVTSPSVPPSFVVLNQVIFCVNTGSRWF